MTAKEYLRQYIIAEHRAARLAEEYEREKEMIDAIKSTSNFDGMPKNKNRKSPEEQIIKLADKAQALKQAQLEALKICQEIRERIEQLEFPGKENKTEKARAMLINRYIKDMQWEQICVAMNYSWTGIHKLHRQTLALLDAEKRA